MPMDRIAILPFAALMQAPSASTSQPAIDFYFTSDAVLERGGAAAMTEWTAQRLAGGEFAAVARGYAPDPQMGADERKAQAAKLDRSAFVHIATDAWRRASSGRLRQCGHLRATGEWRAHTPVSL
jgi:hypothetical protein